MSSYRLDADGRLIVGSVGALGNGQIRTQWARRKVTRFFPGLESVRFDNFWHGTIAMTSDHLPKIVELGNNAYSIFGYSGRGIGPGTVFGKAAAEALLYDDPTCLPMTPKEHYREQMASFKSAFYQWEVNAVLGAENRF